MKQDNTSYDGMMDAISSNIVTDHNIGLSIEELLKDRYKVTAEDTSMNFKVGDILTKCDLPRFEDHWVTNKHLNNRKHNYIYKPEKYPHLFKKLEWWQEREESDMPGYVKNFAEDGTIDFVLKVEKYLKFKDLPVYPAFEYLWKNEPIPKRMSLMCWLPATKEEYEQFERNGK